MKKLLLLLPFLMICSIAEAKKVKFAVDMTGVSVGVSVNGVHLISDFQMQLGATNNWDPAATPLVQETGTQIYSIVVDLPAFQKYEYKFVNGDQLYEAEFVPDESRIEPVSNDNRWLYVDSLTTDTMFVGAIMFGDLTTGAGNAPIGKTLLRFKVDMRNYSPVSASGVHVAGDFQGFDPATTRMYSFSDSIYQHIAYVTAGTYQYKYYNGNTTGTAEIVPAACATSGNRSITVTTHTVLDPICFSTCTVCGPTAIGDISNLKDVTVAPNPAQGFTTVSFGKGHGVYNVQMLDISGRTVANYRNVRDQSLTITTSNLPHGFYILKVSDDNSQVRTIKLINN